MRFSNLFQALKKKLQASIVCIVFSCTFRTVIEVKHKKKSISSRRINRKTREKMVGLGSLRMTGFKVFQERFFFLNRERFETLQEARNEAFRIFNLFLSTSERDK